jgi:hypothetical protein
LLKHPRKCPHGHAIPLGKCCKKWYDNFWRKEIGLLNIHNRNNIVS